MMSHDSKKIEKILQGLKPEAQLSFKQDLKDDLLKKAGRLFSTEASSDFNFSLMKRYSFLTLTGFLILALGITLIRPQGMSPDEAFAAINESYENQEGQIFYQQEFLYEVSPEEWEENEVPQLDPQDAVQEFELWTYQANDNLSILSIGHWDKALHPDILMVINDKLYMNIIDMETDEEFGVSIEESGEVSIVSTDPLEEGSIRCTKTFESEDYIHTISFDYNPEKDSFGVSISEEYNDQSTNDEVALNNLIGGVDANTALDIVEQLKASEDVDFLETEDHLIFKMEDQMGEVDMEYYFNKNDYTLAQTAEISPFNVFVTQYQQDWIASSEYDRIFNPDKYDLEKVGSLEDTLQSIEPAFSSGSCYDHTGQLVPEGWDIMKDRILVHVQEEFPEGLEIDGYLLLQELEEEWTN